MGGDHGRCSKWERVILGVANGSRVMVGIPSGRGSW